MRIVLATGIYPPDIGGPATYTAALAEQLTGMGHEVTVVTYGCQDMGHRTQDIGKDANSSKSQVPSPRSCDTQEKWKVIYVSKSGGPLLRWWGYSKALKQHGSSADVIYAFSSVSCGVPLILSGLVSSRARRGISSNKPKILLRLGGDFFWERYTALGGTMGLREWYESRGLAVSLCRCVASWILNKFDYIVFSTRFQEEIYEDFYTKLPEHGVVENAVPTQVPSPKSQVLNLSEDSKSSSHLRLLFLGRFVGFKNLLTLVRAMQQLPNVQLTMVGDGPYKQKIEELIVELQLEDRVMVQPPTHGQQKQEVFARSDWMILPSTTEISPNVALEAVSSGLPVLLTTENGLSTQLQQGMVVRRLQTEEEIVAAIQECIAADAPAMPKEGVVRGWEEVAEETVGVFREL